MTNKAQRVLEHMSQKDRDCVMALFGGIPHDASPLQQARYIQNVLSASNIDNLQMQDAMMQCGTCCISDSIIQKAKRFFKESASIEEFLHMLNNADIGGGHLHLKDEKIIGIYKQCYCNIPKQIDQMNPLYCQCSAGWYQSLFSNALGKDVHVKILDTILNGAEECSFEITIG